MDFLTTKSTLVILGWMIGAGGFTTLCTLAAKYVIRLHDKIEMLSAQVNSILSADAVFNNFPYPMWEKDMEGRYVRVNSKFHTLFLLMNDLSEDSILFKKDNALFDEDTATLIRKGDLSVLSSHKTLWNENMNVVLRNGKDMGYWDITKCLLNRGADTTLLGFAKKYKNN